MTALVFSVGYVSAIGVLALATIFAAMLASDEMQQIGTSKGGRLHLGVYLLVSLAAAFGCATVFVAALFG